MSYNLEWRGYDGMIRQMLRFNYVTAEGEKHMYVWALSLSSREQQPPAGLAGSHRRLPLRLLHLTITPTQSTLITSGIQRPLIHGGRKQGHVGGSEGLAWSLPRRPHRAHGTRCRSTSPTSVTACSLWSTATPPATRRTPTPQLWPRQSWSVTLRPRTLRRIPAMEAMDYN